MKSAIKGFTLIELMVTLVIISILAAIAYPSYQSSVRKAKRDDAKAALLGAAQALEQYYSTNNTYVGASLSDTAGAGVVFADHAPSSGSHANRYYDLSLTVLTASAFTVSAAPMGVMASDTECGTYTLTSTGVKGVSGSWSVKDCW